MASLVAELILELVISNLAAVRKVLKRSVLLHYAHLSLHRFGNALQFVKDVTITFKMHTSPFSSSPHDTSGLGGGEGLLTLFIDVKVPFRLFKVAHIFVHEK